MSEKTLKQIMTALGVLIVVYFVARLVSGGGTPAPVTGGRLADALTRFAADTLVGADITSPRGRQLALRATPGGWTVDGFRADSSLIERLKQDVGETRVADLAGRNPDNFSVMGVATDSAWHVTLLGRHDSLRLLVGGPGAVAPSAYMRLPDDSTVYDVATGLLTKISLRQEDWRDHAILRVDTARIATVLIERDGQQFAIVRQDSVWKGRSPADSVSRQDAAGVLIALDRYNANGFLPDSAWKGKEARRVVALGSTGDTLAMVELRGDSTAWAVRKAGDPQLYQVSDYDANRLAPRRADLMPKSAGH
jgi:hypothetical protein